MNHYEDEIAERLKHHLMRANNAAAPGAEATDRSSLRPSLEGENGGVGGVGGVGGGAAAAGNVARVEEGNRSSATELAEATAAAGTGVQYEVR